ncbi:MAG: aminoglycoside phosphotransferase family protein, partial [Acidiferrobacterales bacterium]|nr:aminoglycoside phosphotransferase family protein [Acidiferrobacterales bacterium]
MRRRDEVASAATPDPHIRATLRAVGRCFGLGGRLREAATLGAGHIHDTYLVTYGDVGSRRRFVHQRINQRVFRDPVRLMENIERVTDHLYASLVPDRAASQIVRHVVTLLRAGDGRSYCIDDAGAYWRTYAYIEGACTHATIDSPGLARDAAAAFGRFVRLLADLPGPRLHETLPHFHDSPWYMEQLRRTVEADVGRLAASVRAELDFAFENETIVHMLASLPPDMLPERVVHNDTKIDNVLFDAASGKALCVIDLDTVMPGSVLYDFGDLVRSAASASREDARELDQVYLRLPIFEGLVQGYSDALLSLLTEEERDLLALAGKLVAFEVGI